MSAVLGIIGPAIGAITEGLKLANTNASRKYIDKLADLELEIQEEEARGYDADDARLEKLYGQLQITAKAAHQELAHAVAARNRT